MAITTLPIRSRTHSPLYDALWKRQLTSYPRTATRMAYSRDRGPHRRLPPHHGPEKGPPGRTSLRRRSRWT